MNKKFDAQNVYKIWQILIEIILKAAKIDWIRMRTLNYYVTAKKSV